MNCPHCKKYYKKNPGVCPQCGFQFEDGVAYDGEELLGFSPVRTGKLSKDASRAGLGIVVFGFCMTAAFLIVTPVMYFVKAAEIGMSSLILSMLMGLFCAWFSLRQLKKIRGVKTYEGEITRKDSQISHEKHKEGRTDRLQIKKDDGELVWLTLPENSSAIGYYRSGDRVRVHSNLPFPEKYDKRSDSKVICVHCGALNDMVLDNCKNCDKPLLKYGRH